MRFGRRVTRRLREQGGYTLVEMLTVLLILGVVMGGLTSVFVTATNADADMNNRFRAQQTARLALDKLRREVHCSSAATPAGSATSSITLTLPTYCKTYSGSTSVTWCTRSVATNRYALYRVDGATCTGGVKWADNLTPRRALYLQLLGAGDLEPREAASRLPGQPEGFPHGRHLRAHRRPRAQEQHPIMRLRRMSLKALAAGKPMGDERGIALVMALGILVVCAIMVTTVIAYTSSGQRTSYFSKARLTAFDAADAGMNNAFAVLNLPTNNSLDPSILPPCHTTNPDTSTPGTTNPTWFTSSTNLTALTSWNNNLYGRATA
ncbi:MAG: prepilin-type N-terminal cleavage/methylation domain-containing protein, partial [Actinobacteria bacterium]